MRIISLGDLLQNEVFFVDKVVFAEHEKEADIMFLPFIDACAGGINKSPVFYLY